MSDDFWANEDWDSRATQVGATGRPEWRISGRGMVLGMLAFGVLTTSSMWIYWTLHVGPFRPFQNALAAAFPHSSPRVDGGQRKMHKGTPKILRVVLRVEFDPVTESARGEQVVDLVEQIAQAPRSGRVRGAGSLLVPGRPREGGAAAGIQTGVPPSSKVGEIGEGPPELQAIRKRMTK